MTILQQKPKYVEGQRLRCVVEKLRSYGVFVLLPDGTRGYIRRRDLAWNRKAPTQQLVVEGETFDAVVLALPLRNENLLLSAIEALPDPWENFVERHHMNSVVEGTVYNLRPHDVFVEIEPGVNGHISLLELAPWRVDKPEDIVWVGDIIEAVIRGFDARSHLVQLSIRSRANQLNRAETLLTKFEHYSDKKNETGQSGHIQNENAERDGIEEHIQAFIEQVGRILVVEDHDSVRVPLVEWLEKRGYAVEGVKSTDAALKKIRQHEYGLCFVDLDIDGHDGLDLVRRIRQIAKKTNVAVMSTPEALDNRSAEIEATNIAMVFDKPLDIVEIDLLLARIGEGRSLPVWQADPNGLNPAESNSLDAWNTSHRRDQSFNNRLEHVVEQLVREAAAQIGLLFFFDPASGQVSIMTKAGSGKMNTQAIYSLDESPVKDVIVDEIVVFERGISPNKVGRFDKLLDLFSFESCIGIPIEAEGETTHALFLLHRDRHGFKDYHLRDAKASATLIAALLEKESLEQRIPALSTLFLNGQLAASFSHEMYNKMPGLEMGLINLESDCQQLEKQFSETSATVEYQAMKQALTGIKENAQDLSATVKLFQRLRRSSNMDDFDVHDVIKKAIQLVHPLARRHKIKIRDLVPEGLPQAKGSGLRLQQSLLNVMINAIQNMDSTPKKGESLTITARCEKGKKDMIQIRISDSGSGIHRRVWEKIFALGYTTREDGSGLGLYIARSLLTSVGGQISVEQSHIALGTTFLIKSQAVVSTE